MNDKLICPFCQQELKYDAWNEVYMCRNPNCKHLLGFGTKELWQELITTRKALDAANAVIMDYAKEKLEKKEMSLWGSPQFSHCMLPHQDKKE